MDSINEFMLQMTDPSYLPVCSMTEIYDMVYERKPPIINGLLYPGTYLFVGAPKVGKSFLMAQLAYHVSTGTKLWNYDVSKGSVLYLALEDNYQRIQNRMSRMFGVESSDNLYFACNAHQMGCGLCEQISQFISEHPDTRLVIIDTLQKVREFKSEAYSYSSDYDTISQLKALADRFGICLLIVHHTRKQQSDDRFDKISGTNGLLGAADGAFILEKEKRTSNCAVLEISGRDQQEQMLYLEKNMNTLMWELTRAESELWKQPPDPMLDKVSRIVTADSPVWEGTATALKELLGTELSANALSRKLNINASRLWEEHKVRYEKSHGHESRTIRLTLCDD